MVLAVTLTSCNTSESYISDTSAPTDTQDLVSNSNSLNSGDTNWNDVNTVCNNQFDIDCDGYPNDVDVDMDGDGILNIQDLDDNNDGIPDGTEAWDADSDGIPDYVDLDPGGDGIINPRQPGEPSDPFDTDGDGIPNSVDWDKDGDGIAD